MAYFLLFWVFITHKKCSIFTFIAGANKLLFGRHQMKLNFFITSLGIVALFILTSCASLEKAGHNYIMRGKILESTGDGVYLCIGSADGATIGQELNVYRYTKVANPQNRAKSNFRREETGKVKITDIVDEHYAKAKILSGDAKDNYIVELHK